MRKFLLYGVNGVINFFVSYGAYVLLAQVIEYRIAVIVAYAIGIGISYVLNGAIVFGVYGRCWLFVVVSLLLMLGNLAITWTLVEAFGWKKEIAQLPAIAVIFVVGFIVNKTFVFSRGPAVRGRVS